MVFCELVLRDAQKYSQIKMAIFLFDGYRTLFFRIWLDGQLRKA